MYIELFPIETINKDSGYYILYNDEQVAVCSWTWYYYSEDEGGFDWVYEIEGKPYVFYYPKFWSFFKLSNA